jgi:c-di-GMP-binding flagellar brake protein YcgR
MRIPPFRAPGNWLEENDAPGMQAVTAMEPEEMAEELEAQQQSRRAVPRFGVDEDAHILLVKHGSTHPCRIVDLSLTGCRVRTKEKFPAGAMVRVEVNFKVRGLAFRFSGNTQWTDGRSLAGIRFVDVPERRKGELVEALSEVEAEVTAKAAKQTAEKLAADVRATALEPAANPLVKQAEVAKKAEVTEQAKQGAPRQSLLSVPRPGLALAEMIGLLAGPPADRRPAIPSPVVPQPSALQKPAPQPTASPLKTNKRERREQFREEVDTSAVIHLINVGSRLEGRILDLSPNGCRIRTDEPFPVGIYTRVETEFHLEGLPFQLAGVIQAIHDRERRNVGIRFLDMSIRKREQVEQLIEEIRELREQGTENRE